MRSTHFSYPPKASLCFSGSMLDPFYFLDYTSPHFFQLRQIVSQEDFSIIAALANSSQPWLHIVKILMSLVWGIAWASGYFQARRQLQWAARTDPPHPDWGLSSHTSVMIREKQIPGPFTDPLNQGRGACEAVCLTSFPGECCGPRKVVRHFSLCIVGGRWWSCLSEKWGASMCSLLQGGLD